MFNKTIVHQSSTEYVPYEKEVTIHEHKAPTDESVALLRDIEKETVNNLLARIDIKTNVIDGLALLFVNELSIDKYKIVAKFNLNGKEYQIEFDIDRFDIHRTITSSDQYNVNRIIVEKIFEVLTKEISKKLLESVSHTDTFWHLFK